MFLDDELLEICIKAKADTPEDVQQLNVDICKKCEDYYKNKLNPTSTKEEVKIILNKTFNLFDSFVRNAKKSDNKKLQILSELFEKHPFKKQFLSHPELNELYNKLK